MYRYINFFCDTVYVLGYQIRLTWLRVSNYLKLLALLATTSEQLVSIPVKTTRISGLQLCHGRECCDFVRCAVIGRSSDLAKQRAFSLVYIQLGHLMMCICEA